MTLAVNKTPDPKKKKKSKNKQTNKMPYPPKQQNPKQPMWGTKQYWKKISVFHQVKGKNTLARNQRQGFGSQPKQELKSKTIFACAQLRLLRQKWRRGGVGGDEKGATGKGPARKRAGKKCIFHQPVYNL